MVWVCTSSSYSSPGLKLDESSTPLTPPLNLWLRNLKSIGYHVCNNCRLHSQ